MASTDKNNPSDTEIASAWEVYKDTGAGLRSRATSLMIAQAVLVVPFVSAAVMRGDFDSTIGFFVLSALIACVGLLVAILAKPKFDSLVDAMSHLRKNYLTRWKPFGDAFSGGHGDADADTSSDYLKLVPDAFVMFWVGALLVDFYLLIVALDALQVAEAVHV